MCLIQKTSVRQNIGSFAFTNSQQNKGSLLDNNDVMKLRQAKNKVGKSTQTFQLGRWTLALSLYLVLRVYLEYGVIIYQLSSLLQCSAVFCICIAAAIRKGFLVHKSTHVSKLGRVRFELLKVSRIVLEILLHSFSSVLMARGAHLRSMGDLSLTMN